MTIITIDPNDPVVKSHLEERLGVICSYFIFPARSIISSQSLESLKLARLQTIKKDLILFIEEQFLLLLGEEKTEQLKAIVRANRFENIGDLQLLSRQIRRALVGIEK